MTASEEIGRSWIAARRAYLAIVTRRVPVILKNDYHPAEITFSEFSHKEILTAKIHASHFDCGRVTTEAALRDPLPNSILDRQVHGTHASAPPANINYQ
jgi:hypothetical protein